MKRLVPILSLLLCQGCLTCIKGDLSERNLDEGSLPVAIGRIEVEGLRHGSEDWAEKQVRQQLLVEKDASCGDKPVDLSLTYRISKNYWQSEFMPNLSRWTLGLVPLYAHGNADIDVAFLRDGTAVYRTRIDGRSHSFYGWLPPLVAGLFPADDWLDLDERAGIDHSVEVEAVRRTVPRLSRLLKKDQILHQICPPISHAAR